jgi:hypothetical protein
VIQALLGDNYFNVITIDIFAAKNQILSIEVKRGKAAQVYQKGSSMSEKE